MGHYLAIVRASRPAQTLGSWAPPAPATSTPKPTRHDLDDQLQDALSRPWVAAKWAGDASGLADKSIDSVGFVLALDLRVLGLNRARVVGALLEWSLRPRTMGWAQQTVDRVERYIRECNQTGRSVRSVTEPTLFDVVGRCTHVGMGSKVEGMAQ